MPSGPLTFRQRDLKAAMKAAKDAGITVARYEVTKDGTIIIIPGEQPQAAELDEAEAVDRELEEKIRNAKV